MPTIEEKMAALEIKATTTRSREEITRAANDAAEVAGTAGGKMTLNHSDHRIEGVQKNFLGVPHAKFSVKVDPAADGAWRVQLEIDDFLRTRETLLFIPVSPWSAPAYKSLKAFSDHLQSRL